MAAATPAGRRDPLGQPRPTQPQPGVAPSLADAAVAAEAADAAGELLEAGTLIGAGELLEPGDLIEADELDEPAELVEPDDLDEPGRLIEAAGSAKVASARKGRRSQPAQPASAPYGSRREARERALSLLYEADAKAITPAALLAEIPVEPPAYVTSLVSGVGQSQGRIDELIARYAIDWTIDRMPVIDRLVVRIATFELLGRPDVPTGVVISEAVELAKRYSTDESGRFVNGVLASIAAEIRPPA